MTEAQEWLELKKRMDTYLKENTDDSSSRQRIFEKDVAFVNNFEEMQSYLYDIEDLDWSRHRKPSKGFKPTNCEIGILKSQSVAKDEDQIFEMIEGNILNLFDPCSKLQIWNAYHLSDKQFFNRLSKAISSSVKGRQQTNNHIYILRNFLLALEANDLISIVSNRPQQWEKAFKIVENLRTKRPALKLLKTAVKHLRGPKSFKDNCKRWFE